MMKGGFKRKRGQEKLKGRGNKGQNIKRQEKGTALGERLESQR